MIYDWIVIGAGPAGIASIGKLIDFGVLPASICWVDPTFTVGDFGTLWRNVPSNTTVELFLKFLNASAAFNYQDCPLDFKLNHASPHLTCQLQLMAEPLQWVTENLRTKVHSKFDTANSLSLSEKLWHVELTLEKIVAKNVVLAIGAEPREQHFSGVTSIPLRDAMDRERLQTQINEHDSIAVFGSSHSAMLVLQNLCASRLDKLINFYRSPLRYAVYLKDYILFDDSGLKGPTAEWARANIDGSLPANLTRVYSNAQNISHHLPFCTKVVYATGFEKRTLPVVENMGPIAYVEECGIIAPGLYGVGIAFPQAITNPLGFKEYRVGLWKFIEYLHSVIPIWLNYPAF